jgi:type IV secretory pathway VirD2 relaxase
MFALGDRSGALRSAQSRSGRSFRLDVRQRVVVKALVSRHVGMSAARGAALAQHAVYLGRSGAGAEGARPEFFDRTQDGIDPQSATSAWADDRHHFRFIISPEHGDRIVDLKAYVRDVMGRVSADLAEQDLEWIGTCHFDTDQPHAHVLIRGKRSSGRDLVMPRAYVSFGFRARAQEAAQERLGDLARPDAERRIWRETEADRFTALDRRLIAAADQDGMVEDGVGASDAWSALTRGRLRHLERLGLAERIGRRFQLSADLEIQLRALQLRRDIIRTLNQRRFAGASAVREFESGRLMGRVVRAGSHDELGATPYVIVADREGVEHYARLRTGTDLPTLGATVQLIHGERGAQLVQTMARGEGFER